MEMILGAFIICAGFPLSLWIGEAVLRMVYANRIRQVRR